LETFYDGYVVNAIMDACYRSVTSRQWEPVRLEVWRGEGPVAAQRRMVEYDEAHLLIKEEVMPDGKTKLILKEKASGKIVEKVTNAR
jgi:hypothetical protein